MARSDCSHAGLRGALAFALFCAAFAGFVASAHADAAPALRLTDAGRWLLAGSVSGAYSEGHAGYGALKRWYVSGSPEAVYFVRDRIGVGLALNGGVAAGSAGSYDVRDSEFGGGLIGSFEVPASRRLGLLFRPFAGYIHGWRTITAAVGPFTAGTSAPGALIQQQAALANALHTLDMGSLRLALSMELLVHLSPHIAIAAGPKLWFDWLFDDGERASWSQALQELPGYYPNDEPPPASPPRVRPYRIQAGLSVSLLFGI